MLTYHVAYYQDVDGITVEALDFPGVISCGSDFDQARMMIQSALVEMAEYLLDNGKPLPIPNPSITDENADFAEPMHLLLTAAPQYEIVARQASA